MAFTLIFDAFESLALQGWQDFLLVFGLNRFLVMAGWPSHLSCI